MALSVKFGGDDDTPATRGSLLEDGILFRFDESTRRLVRGHEVSVEFGDAAAAVGSPSALRGVRATLRIDYSSATVGVYGTFVGELPPPAAACLRDQSDATRQWIADALGDSEFRWDTLAVHRSMLRFMLGALVSGESSRAAFTNALLADAGIPLQTRSIAAAMAEFDGLGKSLSHDYALARPEPSNATDPLRLVIYPHLLVCIGTFLSNYKRRFVIQNALDIDTGTKLALHRELIVGDTTDEGNRAVWIDWARAAGGRDAESLDTANWLHNARAIEWAEQFDTGLRLWRVLARPSEGRFCALRDAAMLAAEARAFRRESALYGHHALCLKRGDDSPRARFLADRLRDKPSWLRAHCNETGAEFPPIDDVEAWSDAHHRLLELPGDAAADWYHRPWPGMSSAVRDAILQGEAIFVGEELSQLDDPADA
jgi:hypothetical protein